MAINPSWVLNDIDLTAAPFAVVYNSSDPGTPEQVIASIETTLTDGDAEEVERHGNRTYSMRVMIESENRSRDENRLALAVRAGELVFNPGDGHPPSVFEVLHGSMSAPDDFDAELNGMRIAELTLTCAPFARTVEPVSHALPSSTSSTVELTTTGWGSIYGSVTYAGPVMTLPGVTGWVSEIGPSFPWTDFNAVRTYTTPLNLSATPYIAMKASVAANGVYFDTWSINLINSAGTRYALFSNRINRLPDGTHVFLIPSSVATDIKHIEVVGSLTSSIHATTHGYPAITMRAIPTATGDPAGRLQTTIQVPVKGTQRTPVSLKLTQKGPQRTWLLYTAPVLETHLAYRPNLRQYNSGWGADPATLSSHALTDSVTADIPASSLPPGGYNVMLRSGNERTSTTTVANHTAEVSVTASIVTDGVVRSSISTSVSIPYLGEPGDWRMPAGFYSVGSLVLPPADIPLSSTSVVRIRVSGGFNNVDEAYAFWMGDGAALTVVNPPSTGSWSEPTGWVEGATIDKPWSSVFVSTTTNKEDGWSPMERIVSWGAHEFKPPYTTMFGASYPPAELTYFPRHHTHVSEE